MLYSNIRRFQDALKKVSCQIVCHSINFPLFWWIIDDTFFQTLKEISKSLYSCFFERKHGQATIFTFFPSIHIFFSTLKSIVEIANTSKA